MRLPEIPSSEFDALLNELHRRQLPLNRYRVKAGDGRSVSFGQVNKRCLAADYSRLCWERPYLYKLLLEFAAKYVPIPFTSITVNQNYSAASHRDKGNSGQSFLVAFGNYTGGELEIEEGDPKGLYDIRHRPIVEDFGKHLHSVKPFEGERFSLVFYQMKYASVVPPPSVREVNGKWVFFRGEEMITKESGMPHPKRGRTTVRFNPELVVIDP